MLLILIPIAWLGVATVVVCLCRMAAMADRQGAPREPQRRIRAVVFELEPAPVSTIARARLRARASGRPRRGSLQPRGLATIHSIR